MTTNHNRLIVTILLRKICNIHELNKSKIHLRLEFSQFTHPCLSRCTFLAFLAELMQSLTSNTTIYERSCTVSVCKYSISSYMQTTKDANIMASYKTIGKPQS